MNASWIKNAGEFPGGLVLVLRKAGVSHKPYQLCWWNKAEQRPSLVLAYHETEAEAIQDYRITLKDLATEAIEGLDTLALEAVEAQAQ